MQPRGGAAIWVLEIAQGRVEIFKQQGSLSRSIVVKGGTQLKAGPVRALKREILARCLDALAPLGTHDARRSCSKLSIVDFKMQRPTPLRLFPRRRVSGCCFKVQTRKIMLAC